MANLPSTTSVAYLLTLLDVAERQGAARVPLLAAAGIAADELHDPLARVPMPALLRLFDAAASHTGNPRIGLDFGSAVRPASYSGLGYVAMTCATLRDAIALIPRFGRLVFDTEYNEAMFEADEHTARLTELDVQPGYPVCIGLVEAVLAGWVTYGRWITGCDEALLEVHLCYAEPANSEAYTRLFRCPVRFNMPSNTLVFPAAFLDLPVRDADPHLHRAMLQAAEAQLDRAFAGLSLTQRVRGLLVELLPGGEMRLELVASRLHMSARTLQRRLADEGASFKGLLDDLRRELAARYVRDPSMSLFDIALLLGFAEQSSLSHAFRDWYGCSPQEYRQCVAEAVPADRALCQQFLCKS